MKSIHTHLAEVHFETNNDNITCAYRPSPFRNMGLLKYHIYYYKRNRDWAKTGSQKWQDIVNHHPQQPDLLR